MLGAVSVPDTMLRPAVGLSMMFLSDIVDPGSADGVSVML